MKLNHNLIHMMLF